MLARSSARPGANHSIGEESVEVEGMGVLTDEYTWIVDPIDVRSHQARLTVGDHEVSRSMVKTETSFVHGK